MRKLRILYCDDEQRFIDEFADRHVGHFEVIGETDIDQVVNMAARHQPDLVLLDLFHPNELSSSETRSAMERALEQIAVAEENLRNAVWDNSNPEAIETLKRLRLRFRPHKLPVLIYSRRGLILLQDEQLREIRDEGAGWALKDGERISDEYERARIERFVKRERRSGVVPRDIAVATVFLVLGFLLAAISHAVGI